MVVRKKRPFSRRFVIILNSGLAPVVQKIDSAIHRINHYPLESAIGFNMTYPLDSSLSSGQCYPSFEQLGPDVLNLISTVLKIKIRIQTN